MSEESKYSEDISIDPQALDIEWTKQAQVFFHYAEMAAKARDAMDRQKERGKIVEAELGLQIRSNPAKFGLEKVTEGGVQSCILLDVGNKLETEKLAELTYEYEVLSSAVRALDQKKAALENLVRLQGQNYFAGPSVPRDVGAEWVKEVERTSARDKVKAAMNPDSGSEKRKIKR